MYLDKFFGSDGFLVEFYSIFWNEIVGFLLKVLNYVYEIGNFFII